MVELRSARPWAISWLRPAPHLPALLLLPSSCLRESEPWAKLIEAWLASAPVQRLLGEPSATTASQLSAMLQASLEQLVSLSGGGSSVLRTADLRMNPMRRDMSVLLCVCWVMLLLYFVESGMWWGPFRTVLTLWWPSCSRNLLRFLRFLAAPC